MIDTQESMTAKLCSFARAYHSNHGKEKIFDDYLAYDLMGKEEYEETGRLIEHCFQKERFDPAYAFHGKDIGDILNTFISPIPLSRASFAERELWRFAYDRGECQYVSAAPEWTPLPSGTTTLILKCLKLTILTHSAIS